tara:strand:- start:1610 stop:1720 length:111 start_codon:yes stop_codon:yes gene_type:complete
LRFVVSAGFEKENTTKALKISTGINLKNRSILFKKI